MQDYMQGNTHYLEYIYIENENVAEDRAYFLQYQSSTKLTFITQNWNNVFHQKMSYR